MKCLSLFFLYFINFAYSQSQFKTIEINNLLQEKKTKFIESETFRFQNFVKDEISLWYKKDDYEKSEDYKNRINKDSVSTHVNIAVFNYTYDMSDFYNSKVGYTIHKYGYDADKEIFTINVRRGDFGKFGVLYYAYLNPQSAKLLKTKIDEENRVILAYNPQSLKNLYNFFFPTEVDAFGINFNISPTIKKEMEEISLSFVNEIVDGNYKDEGFENGIKDLFKIVEISDRDSLLPKPYPTPQIFKKGN